MRFYFAFIVFNCFYIVYLNTVKHCRPYFVGGAIHILSIDWLIVKKIGAMIKNSKNSKNGDVQWTGLMCLNFYRNVQEFPTR